MSLKDSKFAFIGAGNIASAIVGGLVSNNLVNTNNIYVYDTDAEKYKSDIMQKVICCDSLSKAVEIADIVFFAVKPAAIKCVVKQVVSDVSNYKDKTYVSVAAAVSSDYICKCFGTEVAVVRTMPNTPLLVGEGAVAVSRNSKVDDRLFSFVCRLLSGIAVISVLDESLMNSTIAVNGSSPAYVYMFYKSLLEGAVNQGMPVDKATPLLLQSIRGALCMLERSGKDVDTLIKDVSSPNGTTLAALSVFYEKDLSGCINEAMTACTKRADEMAADLEDA